MMAEISPAALVQAPACAASESAKAVMDANATSMRRDPFEKHFFI